MKASSSKAIFNKSKSLLVDSTGARQYRIPKTCGTCILMVILLMNCIPSSMCVVQGSRTNTYRNNGNHHRGGAGGAREVGSVMIHGNPGETDQGVGISYSIAVEGARPAVEEPVVGRVLSSNTHHRHHGNSRPNINNSNNRNNNHNRNNQDSSSSSEEQDNLTPPNGQQIRWAEAAFKFVRDLDCSEVFFTSERECRALKRRSKADMAIHIADPGPQGRLATVLPDGGLSRSGTHDAVVVLDPYPAANFGHLVLVFYVDIHMGESWCHTQGGTFLEQECITQALKKRCKNALGRRGRRKNFARRCEINFLPVVYREDDAERANTLRCRGNMPGFAPCPDLRPINETSGLVCNPLEDNSNRCETSHDTVHTSCRVFEICDQAVIVSGGWNRRLSLPRHKDNVKDVYHFLRNHGYHRKNIQVFFANGADPVEVSGEAHHEVHPAAQKLAMRYHIQKLCGSLHCADSFTLYLNSPTKSDGSMLLWDVDKDGEVSEKERYSMEELLSDLSDCQARQVYVVADQSYSGLIVRAIRRSKHHHNVAVFASGKDHEYSYGSEFTHLWTSYNQTHQCVQDVHKEVKKRMQYSTPDVEIGKDVNQATIFGAPCDVIPPYTHRELRQNYLGCQNLPTALWVAKFISSTQQSAVLKDMENRPFSDATESPPTLFRNHRGL